MGLLLVIAACGAVPGPASTTPPVAGPAPARTPRAPVAEVLDRDPIAALTPASERLISWLDPGRVQLELGAPPIDAPGPAAPLLVEIIARHGKQRRVAVRLEHARFSVWTDQARLLSLLQREQRLAGRVHAKPGEPQVILRAGAPVARLGSKDDRVHVRYLGGVQVEGWVARDALGERAPRLDRAQLVFMRGNRRTSVIRGAVIRTEPKWASRELAIVDGYGLERERELEGGWMQVRYADSDVTVTGYLSRRLPPGRLHRVGPDPEVAPTLIVPTATAASGTCLYGRIDGDPVGYLVGDVEVDLAPAGRGWWHLSIDTPWGAIAFAARGVTATELTACAPAGTVPAPAVGAASVP